MFVALEGIDGCGKTTLAKGLEKNDFFVTQEPYLTLTKDIVGRTKNDEARELAFYIDRLYHIDRVITPNLKRGVITDRYKYSQIAYAYARYSGGEIYKNVVSLNQNLLEPDMVLFLDIKPEESLLRKPGIINDASPYLKISSNYTDFFNRIKEKYMDLQSENWKVIDANNSKEKILEEALKLLSKLGFKR
jgi:dTMP kinase|tara:strand:- start:1501 stop:2070 length:570 start_codon:yes stop_codon:yes gene_type:complete